jgi:hypothetical protein
MTNKYFVDFDFIEKFGEAIYINTDQNIPTSQLYRFRSKQQGLIILLRHPLQCMKTIDLRKKLYIALFV